MREALRSSVLVLLVMPALVACSCRGPLAVLDGSSSTRRPAIDPDHPLYDRVEGTGFDNACSSDADCFLGGCSAEVCSGVKGVVTTCEVIDWPPAQASCGCVADQCVWYVLVPGG